MRPHPGSQPSAGRRHRSYGISLRGRSKSGHTVEGFDADEPYGAQRRRRVRFVALDRAWVSTHNYNHYAYDPRCRLLVSGRGYLYDPDRMDRAADRADSAAVRLFLGRDLRQDLGPRRGCAWAPQAGERAQSAAVAVRPREGVDRSQAAGQLFAPTATPTEMVYDSRRDRMILSGVGGGYGKISNGTFLAFDFKTRARDAHARERRPGPNPQRPRMAYLEHADWVLIGELYIPAAADRPTLHAVYDARRNGMVLLEDAGDVPFGHHGVDVRFDAEAGLRVHAPGRGLRAAGRPQHGHADGKGGVTG